MPRRAVTGLVPQYAKNAGGASSSGYWLKFYAQNTTTPINMYTAATGGVALAKCTMNTRGEPISTSSDDDSVFIPYLDIDYDAYLFFTEADADANDTGAANYLGRHIEPEDDPVDFEFAVDSVSEFILLGVDYDSVYIRSYYPGWAATVAGPKGGFLAHATGGTNASPTAGTAVSASSIGGGDGTGSTTGQSVQAGYFWTADGQEWLISETIINALMFGAVGDYDTSTGAGTDNSGVFSDIASFVDGSDNVDTVHITNGSYRGKIDSNGYDNQTWILSGDSLLALGVGDTGSTIRIEGSTGFNVMGGASTSFDRVSRLTTVVSSNFCKIENHKGFFATKSTYSGAAIYDKAAFFLENAIRCEIIGCEAYNIEGAGVTIIGSSSGNLVQKNYIHDNLIGVINNGNSNSFNRFIDNDIGFNDVSGGSGNDGILINASDIGNASSGHTITGNRIYNSGEHGMYAQCSNTLIANNRVYSNAECGIKVAKCRTVTVSNNIIYSNESSIQVQSGYEDVLIEGNTCKLASGSFDLDFTWNTGLDPFGGKDVKIIGNYFLSNVANWSADIDGSEGLIFENNTCAKGLIYSSNATGAPYPNVKIKDNEFLDGTLRLINCDAPVIKGNKMVNLFCPDSNNNVILENNVITALNIGTRKDVQLNAFASICNNIIDSTDTGGAPNFEIFNGQDATVTGLKIIGNTITTAGAIIFNVNTSGGLIDSVISNNTFDDGGVGPAFQCTTASTNNAFIGNVGMSGTITSANSTGVGNTGGATFGGAGSSYANNI